MTLDDSSGVMTARVNGRGCSLRRGDDRPLRTGDVVEREIEGIGVLRNAVVTPLDTGRS